MAGERIKLEVAPREHTGSREARRLRNRRVLRLLRIRVNFTSTLPRHGRAVICPNCRTILSAAVTIA